MPGEHGRQPGDVGGRGNLRQDYAAQRGMDDRDEIFVELPGGQRVDPCEGHGTLAEAMAGEPVGDVATRRGTTLVAHAVLEVEDHRIGAVPFDTVEEAPLAPGDEQCAADARWVVTRGWFVHPASPANRSGSLPRRRRRLASHIWGRKYVWYCRLSRSTSGVGISCPPVARASMS